MKFIQSTLTTLFALSALTAATARGDFIEGLAAESAPPLRTYFSFDNTFDFVDNNNTVQGAAISEPFGGAGFSGNVPTGGGAASLDLTGANTRVRVPFSDAVRFGNAGSDFSVSMWINPDSGGASTSARIFDSRGTGGALSNVGMQLTLNEQTGGGFSFTTNSVASNGADAAFATITPPGNFGPDDSWHHVAFLYNSTSQDLSFFIDGAAAGGAISVASDVPFDGLKDLALGSEVYANSLLIAEGTARGQKFTGLIDEFAVFDGLLSTDQITGLANGSLVASDFFNVPLAPEPSTFILFGVILTLLAGYCYRRRRTATTAR